MPVFIGIFNTPPTTGTWFAPGCLSICESTVSQEAADDCAAAQAVTCSFDGAPDDGNPLPNGIHPAQRFGNTTQECTAECDDGNGATLVIPAGTVISFTQADADARAHSLACKRAEELKVCFVTSSPLPPINANEFSSIPIIAIGGNGDYEFVIISGSIPTGMTFDAVGLLSGTPTGSGTSTFEITVTDTGGASATKTFSIEVMSACGAVVDWLTDNTSCRPRIQNYSDSDWPGSGGCTVSQMGVPGWDGTFPTFLTPGGGPNTYESAAPGLSVTSHLIWNPFGGIVGRWEIKIGVPFTFGFYQAEGPTIPNVAPRDITGTYTKISGCTGPATLVIEGYAI